MKNGKGEGRREKGGREEGRKGGREEGRKGGREEGRKGGRERCIAERRGHSAPAGNAEIIIY
jgi:flagellar biosynthesis/type III secretory pathway protein FliH